MDAQTTSARARLEAAKSNWTHAATLALKGHPEAERLAVAALAELSAARKALQRQHDIPAPTGVWAEAALLHGVAT